MSLNEELQQIQDNQDKYALKMYKERLKATTQANLILGLVVIVQFSYIAYLLTQRALGW